ncbi:ElaA protein [Pelagirhabdus alkalitolerans]|uniref:ElaA protein n=1 Tax=Pelagirhabdus alkalitolerans TaxID=1612202 RepID=A0A1G6JI58_9BACI|nr:GNAT family N-acetyltransferase [Pelagirhabdus alkalitolerans]SDC18367.1 ElaA protein [Pelagirhabdus alkalitolerans]
MENWIIKSFDQLLPIEWYKIATLRSDTFIVEQDSAYHEFDSCDQVSDHIFLMKNDDVVAYARLIPNSYFYDEASIGRVIVKSSERGNGYAKALMEQSILHMFKKMNEPSIKIQAEAYLEKFYGTFGFESVSEKYFDCDIEHVDMLLKRRED